MLLYPYNNEKDCINCKWSGFDIADGPYCAHPEILKEYPYGLLLHCKIDQCLTPNKPLFEKKDNGKKF